MRVGLANPAPPSERGGADQGSARRPAPDSQARPAERERQAGPAEQGGPAGAGGGVPGQHALQARGRAGAVQAGDQRAALLRQLVRLPAQEGSVQHGDQLPPAQRQGGAGQVQTVVLQSVTDVGSQDPEWFKAKCYYTAEYLLFCHDLNVQAGARARPSSTAGTATEAQWKRRDQERKSLQRRFPGHRWVSQQYIYSIKTGAIPCSNRLLKPNLVSNSSIKLLFKLNKFFPLFFLNKQI